MKSFMRSLSPKRLSEQPPLQKLPTNNEEEISSSPTKSVDLAITHPRAFFKQLSLELPVEVDEELRARGIRPLVNPQSTKERIIFEIYQNEKYHAVMRNWGQDSGIYLMKQSDRAPFTYVDASFDNRAVQKPYQSIKPITGYCWEGDWEPLVRRGHTDEEGYQYGKSWNDLMHVDDGSVKSDNCFCRRRILRRIMIEANEESQPILPYSLVIRIRNALTSYHFEKRKFRHFHVEVYYNQQFIYSTQSKKPEWNNLLILPIDSLKPSDIIRFELYMNKIFRLPHFRNNKNSHGKLLHSIHEDEEEDSIGGKGGLNSNDDNDSDAGTVLTLGSEITPDDHPKFQLIGIRSVTFDELQEMAKYPEYTLQLFYPKITRGFLGLGPPVIQEQLLPPPPASRLLSNSVSTASNPLKSLLGLKSDAPLPTARLVISPKIQENILFQIIPNKQQLACHQLHLYQYLLSTLPLLLQEQNHYLCNFPHQIHLEEVFSFYLYAHYYLTMNDLQDIHNNLLQLLQYHQRKMPFLMKNIENFHFSSEEDIDIIEETEEDDDGDNNFNELNNNLVDDRLEDTIYYYPHQRMHYSTIYTFSSFLQWKETERNQRNNYFNVLSKYRQFVQDYNRSLSQQTVKMSTLYDLFSDSLYSYQADSRLNKQESYNPPDFPSGGLTIVYLTSNKDPTNSSSSSANAEEYELKEIYVQFRSIQEYCNFFKDLSWFYSSQLNNAADSMPTPSMTATARVRVTTNLNNNSSWEDCLLYIDKSSQTVALSSLVQVHMNSFQLYLLAYFHEVFLIAHNTHYLEDIYSCEISLKKSDIIKALPSDYKQYVTSIRLSIQTTDGTDYDNLEIDSKALMQLLSSEKDEAGKEDGEGDEEEDEDNDEESLEILLPGWILNDSHQKVNVSDIITSISIHLLQPSTVPTPFNAKGNKGKVQGFPQNALSLEHKLLLSTFRMNLSNAYSLSSLLDNEGSMSGDRSTMMTFYDNTVNSREPKPINTLLMFSTSDSDGITPNGRKNKVYFQLKVLSMKNVLISDTLTKSSDVYYLLYFTDDQGRKLSPLKSSTIDIVLPPSLPPLEALRQSSAALLQLPNASTTLDAISRTLPTQEDCIFFRSEIKHLDINPTFNNTHVITEDIIRLYGVGKAMYLLMEVWDHNKTRSDVPLGEVFFPLVCGVKTGSTNGERRTFVLPIQPSARMANYHMNNSSSNKVISDVGLGQVIVEITTSEVVLTENRGSVKINENRKSINRNSLRSTPPKVHLPNPGPGGLSQEEMIDLSVPVKLSLKQLHPTDRRWPARFINSSATFVPNANGKGKAVTVNNDCYSQLFYADIQHDALVITPYFPVNNIILPSSYDLLKIFSECFENKDRRKEYFPPPPTSPLATLPQANDQISRPRLFSDEKQRNKHRKNHFFHQLFSFHKHSSSKKKDNHSNNEENKKAVPTLQRGNNINNKSRKGSASSDKINNPSGKRSSSIHEGKNNDIFRNICIEIDYDKILPDNISILSPNTLLIKISLKRLMSKPYKNGIQYEQKKIDYEFMIGPCPAVEIYAYILAYMEMHQLRKCIKDLMIYPKQRSIPLIEVDTLHDNMIQKLHIINQEIENYEQEYFHNQDHNHHHHETDIMPAFTPHVTTPPTTSSTFSSYSPHESHHVTWQLQYSWNTYFTPKHYLHGNFYSLLIMKLTLLGYYQYFLYITTYIDKYWLPDSASSTDDRLVNDDSMPTFNSYQTNYDDPMVIKALTNDMELKLRQISLNETSEQENTQLYIIANEIFVDLSFHIRMIYLFYHKKEQKERIEQLTNEFNSIREGVNDGSHMDMKKMIDNIIKRKKESRNIEIGLSIINQLIYQQYLQFIIYLKYAIEVAPNQTTNTTTTTTPDSSSKQSTFLGFGKKSNPITSNPTTPQQSSSSSGKSKFHHDLINFIITEDLILERYLFPYLNCHSYTFLHQPVLSKCIEFKQLIYEFIQYLDSSISYWNTTAIRNIMSGQTTLPNVTSPVKSEGGSGGGSGFMRGGSESVSRISLSDLRGASMNHQALMRRKMTRKLSNALSPNNHPSSNNTSRHRTMTSMRGHASSRYLYYQEKAKEEAAAVASYGYDRDTDNTVHSTVFPWSITLATIYPSNETLVQSDIPELIQIMLNIQIGTRKISSLSYERLSIINIKRIFIINWKIAYALTRSYTTLLLSYRYYVNEIVKKMIINSMKTEKKFHLFISNYLTQRLKDFSHSHSPMHSHSEGVIQDITFTIQSIAATTANIITSSIPFSNTTEEDRQKEMKEEEEKKIQQQEIVDDLICFLLSMINDCIRIQQILIPETLDSFIQEYRYISNDLLLSSHHTKSNSSKKHDSVGSDRGIRPVSDGSTSINDSNNTNNNYYSRVLSRRKSSMMKKSGNINDNGSNNTNNNIAIKQFQYLFQKPLQLTTSIIHEIINHLCNQLFFYSDLKSYYMETIESFILLKGLSKKSQKSLFSNKYSYLQEKLSLHFQQLPKLLITPFFRSRTQSNLNNISHKKYLSSSLDDGDEEITGNVNNMSANNTGSLPTDYSHTQQEEEQREEVDATPMEVMMATLTEFYSFIGKFVQLPVLYEIIYHCMIKLVMRYLLLIRDISLNNKYRYEQKQSKLHKFINHAPEVVVSIPVGVAYGVIHTVPHLAKSLANAVTGERNTHNSTTTPSISEEGNLEEKMLKELEEEADDENDVEEEEAASSGVYLKNAQLEQMKKDLQIIIQAHSQITDEKIHSLLRFLNMAIVDIWSSSSDQSDQHSMTFIDRLLVEQFKSSPPPYIPSDSYFLPSILSSSTSSSSSSAVYRQQLEQYLLDCNQFHDFTDEELMKENAKHFTIQISDIAIVNLKSYRWLAVRVKIDQQIIETKNLNYQQRRSLMIRFDDIINFDNIQNYENKEITIELVELKPWKLFRETIYGVVIIRLSDLRPYIITETKHYTVNNGNNEKIEAVNDEMEEFYREYNESLNNTNNHQHTNNKNNNSNSGKLSSSNRSSKGKKGHNSHTKASMTANRGLCGWFKVYPDLHSAVEARERLHPTNNNNNNTTSNGNAQSQSNTFNYNQMLLNPYFTEDPIIQESSDSGSRGGITNNGIMNNNSGNGNSSSDHSSIPIQIQVRLRVFEYIPLDHNSNT